MALVALSSSNRGQTLHALDIEKIRIENDAIVFTINVKLKTTRKLLKPRTVKCVSTDNPALNVCDHVIAYMNRTLPIRAVCARAGKGKPTQLFLSWATKNPVSKQTLARWLKQVLGMAGISNYGALSYRGAGLSDALAKGVPIEKIIKAGVWTNARTFNSFYNKPSESSEIGKIILNRRVSGRVLTVHLISEVFLQLAIQRS